VLLALAGVAGTAAPSTPAAADVVAVELPESLASPPEPTTRRPQAANAAVTARSATPRMALV
jgi:hypothetical protein